MKESKVHYVPDNNGHERTQCGNRGRLTYVLGAVTCRVCMFSYLADQAPWAREFLDGLRKVDTALKRSAGKTLQDGFKPGLTGLASLGAASTVSVPAPTTEQVHCQEEHLGRQLRSLLGYECRPKKLVSELLSIATPTGTTVEPVVDDGGTTAEPVGVQPGKVTEQAGDAGQIGDEPGWNF